MAVVRIKVNKLTIMTTSLLLIFIGCRINLLRLNMNDNKSSGALSWSERVRGQARQYPDPWQMERKRKQKEEEEADEKRMKLRVQEIGYWGEKKEQEARKLTMTAIRRGANSGSKNYPLHQKGVVPHVQQNRGEEAWERYKMICASSPTGFNDRQTAGERISVLQEAVRVDSQLMYR